MKPNRFKSMIYGLIAFAMMLLLSMLPAMIENIGGGG